VYNIFLGNVNPVAVLWHGKFVLSPGSGRAAVVRHGQIVEDQSDVARELAHFLRHAAHAFGDNHAYGKAAQPGDVFRPVSFSDTAAVLVEVPVDDVMAFVFDAPMAAVYGQQAFGVGLFDRPAGDAQGDVARLFAAFFVDASALDDKSLFDVRKVEKIIEFGGGPDLSLFDAAVIRRVEKDEIGLAAVFEEQTDVFEQAGLVVFDGEVVVGVALLDDVFGELSLCQLGIGGDVFVFDIDGIEQGLCGFDFVGALDLLVVYGQVAYFFWV